MLSLLLLGCAPQTPLPWTEDSAQPDSAVSGSVQPDTTLSDTGAPALTEESIGDQVVDDSWIFSHEVIHDVEITLPESSVDALYADPYTYAEGAISFDGVRFASVGVRLRGKIGSFRDLGGKPKLKIDFNQYIPEQRFYGLETLSLNNAIVDCSYLKEIIGYALFEAADVPASRTGLARVWINGAPYGLYVLVEVPDDRFLVRTYSQPDGNLYDGKYVWYGGYSYTLLDFAEGNDTLYQLEEGTDVAHADISAVSDAVAASAGAATWYADVGMVVDWAHFHREWAVEQWLGQNDGYGLNTNNYRVYFDPEDGRADILPWDLDYSFLYDWEWGLSWSSPPGKLAYYCINDAACAAAQREAVAAVLSAAEDRELVTLFDQLAALIDDDARSDPRRECAESSIDSEQAEVRAWLESQNETMRVFWGL